MEVILAESAGFCFGVKRAVDMVYEQADNGEKPIYTYGPIIHNEEVVSDLKRKGVEVIEGIEQLKTIIKGTVIIRSHGVSPKVYEIIENQHLCMVDATCPFVKKIHQTVHDFSQKGYEVIIIGNASHPEVQGIYGWCQTGHVHIVNTEDEICKVPKKENGKICIVAQTTFNYKKFQELVEVFKKKGYTYTVVNTICNATEERQQEAVQIAKTVDAMIVIGGKSSSNTQKLYEICQGECVKTYYIQTLDDLVFNRDDHMQRIGITAGASTPNNIIKEVQNYVRNEF